MGKWQKVYSTNILHRAEIVKAVLEDQGLQPVIISKKEFTNIKEITIKKVITKIVLLMGRLKKKIDADLLTQIFIKRRGATIKAPIAVHP